MLKHRCNLFSRFLAALPLAMTLAGCSSSDGDDPNIPGTAFAEQAGKVTISGTISYDFVPAASIGGLDYAATEVRPARGVTVQFIEGAQIVTGTSTDDNGRYSLQVAQNTTGFVRARAESVSIGSPRWRFRVLDNVNGDQVYALDGSSLSSGTADSQRDLHAPSGWTGMSYGEERMAAPFAILDTITIGAEFVVDAGLTDLPDLDIHWSPDNVATYDEDGNPDPDTGEIGSSFYGINPLVGINGIYLLGQEGGDTEEYDPHVILHEFGHYLENAVGRSDNIGGSHSRGDILDPRVAFSEGWGTAFAALALGDPIYRDTGGSSQGGSFAFNVEGSSFIANPNPGWFSEESVWELIYDLGDAGVDADGSDLLAYSPADIWSVMVGRIVTTPSLTTIFPFVNAIKSAHAGDESLLDALTAGQMFGPVTSDYGIGETNDTGDPEGAVDVLPIYTELTVNGSAVTVCSTDAFSSATTGSTNKLSSRRFIRFTPPEPGIITIDVEASSIPDGHYADPDWILHRFIPVAFSNDAPTAACQDIEHLAWTPAECVEPDPDNGPATMSVVNAEHVLEVYEWTNTNDAIENPEYPPIGRTCFNVTVTQQ